VSFRHWLPLDAYLGDGAKEAFTAPLAGWSADWFAGTSAVVSKVRAGENARAHPVPGEFEISGTGTTLQMVRNGKKRLLEALLHVRLSDQPCLADDGAVLDALAREAAQDLLHRIDDVVAGSADDAADVGVRSTICIGNAEIFEVVLAAHAFVPLLKARLRVSDRPAGPPGDRNDALRRTRLVTRATLGQVEVSLDDLRKLNADDVLILDRALDEPVELRVTADGPPIARGALRQSGDKIAIQL
jgi:flagellar motor switch/type III secretory pathway protein FliN